MKPKSFCLYEYFPKYRCIFTFVACILLVSCSPLGPKTRNEFLSSGSIIISQTIPPEAQASGRKIFAPILGFFPSEQFLKASLNETWLRIDTSKDSVELYYGDTVVFETSFASGVLPRGEFRVERLEESPLWEAPKSYFERRGLHTPTESGRLLRGALGQSAVYLSGGPVLHSSPLYCEDVGGVKIAATQLRRLSGGLTLGTRVVID